jgi:hypothetical protein
VGFHNFLAFVQTLSAHPYCTTSSNDLANNIHSLFIRPKQFLALFSLSLDRIILVQQVLKQVFLVKLCYKPVLHAVLAMVNQKMHDSFRYLVGDGLADNVEV